MEKTLPMVTMDDLLAIVRAEAIQANGVFEEGTEIIIHNRGDRFMVKVIRPEGDKNAEV